MRLESEGRAWEEPQVFHEVQSWTRFFAGAGIEPREPVVVEGLPRPESVFALLGLRALGACAAPVHPALSDEEAAALVARLRPRLVVASRHRRWSSAAAQVDWSPPPRLELGARSRRLRADYVLFTSGSEGDPKGVLLTEEGFAAHRRAARARLAPTGMDRWLLSLSPAHVGGLALLLRAFEEPGTTLVCPPGEWTHDVSGTITRHRISHVSLVPTLLRRWVDASAPASHVRLVLVGGAHCPQDLAETALKRGFPLRLTYGLTEAYSQVATSEPGSPPGSVGRALECIQVRIEEATGRILLRGATRFTGYLGKPPLPASAWFRTGDLGRLDGSGNLFVVGRADDVIISGGENVDPVEVEAALESHPGVESACVVGKPHPEWGHEVVALIVPRRRAPRETALRRHLRARLAAFKVPKRFHVVGLLPRTPTGKLDRRAARRLIDDA